MFMKKHLILFVVLLVSLFAFVGCDKNKTTTQTSSSTTTTAEQSTTTLPEVTTTATPTTTTVTITDLSMLSENDIKNMTSLELTYYMGNGTNLGNTMEAFGRTEIGTTSSPDAYETIWGQPITTAAMIQGMKDAGFDTLRIPVAWTNTMDIDNGNYTISPAYLARVAEIVNYALDADMFVIINDHWDGGWWGLFGSENQANNDKAWAIYQAMWGQIGDYFKDYSYRLIFESANEELGNRLNDAIDGVSGVLTENECYEMAADINQEFVDLIRAQGSNNADRFLLIAGYNTDITMTYDDRFSMPTDSASNKLLLSVHYYTPWTYCGTSGDAVWASASGYNTQNELMEKMTKYTALGYGVIFGEFAVMTKSDGTLKTNALDFFTNFLDNCDKYGYVPVLWDTNMFYKRDTLEIFDQDLADFYASRNFAAQSSYSYDEIVSNAQASMTSLLEIAIQYDIDHPNGTVLTGDEVAVAWLMYTSNDWSVSYSVGDSYTPSEATVGLVATDVIVEGAGTYTIGLDFTGTGAGYATGVGFSAIGLSNGELLYPGYIIEITQILLNGVEYDLTGFPYTASDDGVCTRVNLYNQWVNDIPDDARVLNNFFLPYVSAVVIDRTEWTEIYTIEITFNYINPNAE